MSEMITDEKRRKAVHTLRQLDNVVDDEDLDRTIAHEASILSMIRDAAFGLDGSIFQRLANPIDRPDNPTCRAYRQRPCIRLREGRAAHARGRVSLPALRPDRHFPQEVRTERGRQ